MKIIEVPYLFGRWGMTLGSIVLIKRGLLPTQKQRTIAHEKCHIEQIQRDGLVYFYWRYFLDWIKYGYQDVPYEIEVRECLKRRRNDVIRT
jgi:muconolactone delta-isomerase